MKFEGQSQRDKVTSHSDNGQNEGIINIKTKNINFKKSQSMRKIKASKMKRIKLKRIPKRKSSKEGKGA